LVELEAESFATDRLSRRSLAALVRSPSAHVLVACRDRHVAGYAVLLTRRGSLSARLYSIAVATSEAGRGVGKRLLDEVEKLAASLGAARLSLEVRADNPAAIRLYERSGYRPIGERADYYEDGMSARIFERQLSSSLSAQRLHRLRRAA
jgi:ribosomal protein S18 acetylase RimI-like enzyme